MTAPGRTASLTLLALAGFAANSLLCRDALRLDRIDAGSFTAVRIGSGAVVLWLLVRLRRRPAAGRGSWRSALTLVAYAAGFSWAYRSLDAGTGALILFAAVQLTMVGAGLAGGERPGPAGWAGLLLACAGLAILTLPGAGAPDALGGTLMAIAGVAWGLYSLYGRTSKDSMADTAGNFARALPFTLLIALAGLRDAHADARGLALAVVSGAIASGVCYSLWYAALPGLTATRAAVVQLSVPVLAAIGATAFLDEPLTGRLLLSGAIVLGGIALVIRGRSA